MCWGGGGDIVLGVRVLVDVINVFEYGKTVEGNDLMR